MGKLSSLEIDKMRKAGRISAEVLSKIGKKVKPGITTNKLDEIAHTFIISLGASPAPLGYKGYPKSICASVNSCICHGVPGSYVLKEGDILNIDITCIVDGFHGDTSRTFYVGEVSERAKKITKCAYEAMWKGIKQVHSGCFMGDIGFAIQKSVTRAGFYPVKQIGGHGIGKYFHEDPFVPSTGKKRKGTQVSSNMCITLEPMVKETSAPIKELNILGSEIKVYETSDQSLSAQFEHTVLVLEDGYEVLTLPPEQDFEIGY